MSPLRAAEVVGPGGQVKGRVGHRHVAAAGHVGLSQVLLHVEGTQLSDTVASLQCFTPMWLGDHLKRG